MSFTIVIFNSMNITASAFDYYDNDALDDFREFGEE